MRRAGTAVHLLLTLSLAGALALAAPIRTQIDAQDVGRLAPEIESTIYFCCHEAVQ